MTHPDENYAYRILDANLNRAREALRVMEEFARFALDDAALCSAIKSARHDLAAAMPAEMVDDLARCRAIEQDVGRAVEGEGEYVRSDAGSVAEASAKRLSEALRSIEEYGKIVDPRFARAIEALRYRGYELERRLLLRRRANERFAGVKLYVLLTEALCRGDWFATAQAALDGGADCLQLREKRLSDRELIARARRIAAHCRQRGALFLVNDRPDIAAVSGADGVHLGQDDMTVADARRLLPAGSIVGCSTHTIEQVAAALAASPDYIAVGPMFSTETKPQDHIAGLATLGEARVASTLPLVAIGGIDCSNVERVVATAPCAICVCGAAIGAVDVAGACRQLRAAIDSSTVSGVL